MEQEEEYNSKNYKVACVVFWVVVGTVFIGAASTLLWGIGNLIVLVVTNQR